MIERRSPASSIGWWRKAWLSAMQAVATGAPACCRSPMGEGYRSRQRAQPRAVAGNGSGRTWLMPCGLPKPVASRSDRRASVLNMCDRVAQNIDAGARSDAVLGEMPAEGARTGDGVIGADKMPCDRVQTRALPKLALDIGQHRLEHLFHACMRRDLAKNIGID